MIRWMAWRKEVEFRVFKKVFRIPDIVDLDKIKARFDDDDATLTITMPKRVKGISGFDIEEEKEEERVDFGEAGEVEEESIERKESDVHSETEIEKEEEFGETMENKEREKQVLEGEEQGFSGGLEEEEFDEKESQVLGEEQKDEEEIEDDYLKKSHQIDEQDKIMERIEEEKELADLNKESEYSSLKKLSDIEERDSHEKIGHEEQELALEQQAGTKRDDFGSRAFEEIDEKEPDILDKTSTSRTMEKEMTDDDGEGLRKVQGNEEPERHNEESKIQETVECETNGHEKKKILRTEIENKDAKKEVAENDTGETVTKAKEFEFRKVEADEVDKIHELVEKKEEEGDTAKVGAQSDDIELQENEEQHRKQEKIKELVEKKSPAAETNIGNDIPKPVQEIQVPKVDTVAKTSDEGKEGKETEKSAKEEVDAKIGVVFASNIADTAMKSEDFECDKLKSNEVKNKDKQEENVKFGAQSEDISLTKLPEIGEQQSQGQKRHDKQEDIKELVDEQAPETEENRANDSAKQVQEIEVPEVDTLAKASDEGKEGKEKKKSVKMDITNEDAKEEVDGFEPNISEAETKAEDIEFDKLKADEVDKRKKLVEKKEEEEENNKVGRKSEDISLKELQELGEQQFQGQKRYEKQEKIKELVEEKAPEAETNIGNDILKPVQERREDKHKILELFQEETKNQPERYKDKIVETGKKINDAGTRKVQELIRQQELDEPTISAKESKTRELVKCKTNDEEKEDKVAETETKEEESYRPKILGEEETKFSKNRKVKEEEETAEEETEFGDDDDISRQVRDMEQQDSDVMKGKEVKDMTQELVLEEKVYDAVTETKAENDKSREVKEIDEQQSHEEDTCGKQEKFIRGEISGRGEVEDVENKKKTTETAEKRIQDRREAQEIEKIEKYIKGTTIQENEENRRIDQNEHEEEKKDEDDRPEKVTTGLIEQELVNLSSKLEQDNVEDGEKTQELVEEEIKASEEKEGSEEAKTRINDDIVRKVQGINDQELYEPKKEHVRKVKELEEEKTGDHDKQKEKKNENSEIEAECGSLRKVHGIEEQELHEPKIHNEEPSGQAEHNDRKEEKVMAKAELETEVERSKKVQEIEQQEYDEGKRSTVQDKMQEPGEKEKSRAMEENEIVESRTKVKDGSLRNVQDDENPELTKPYKRQKEDKIQELVEMGTSDYREKVKKQDENNILRGQEDLHEYERHGEQSNIPQMVEEEKLENIAELGEKMKDNSLSKFHEFVERREETEEKDKNRAMKENEIVERRTKTKDGSLRKVREKEEEEESGETKTLVKEEAADLKDKHIEGEGEYEEEERFEKVLQTTTKGEDEINKKIGENKEVDWDKHERCGKLDKLAEVLREGASDRKKEEENLVDDLTTKIQETEKEESHELEMHEKLDIVSDFVKDETGDQEGDVTEEATAVVASNEGGSSRKVQMVENEEGEESEKQKEQDKIHETSDSEVKEEYEERVAEKETKELEAQVQELEEKTEKFKDDDGDRRRGEKGKQGKIVETMSREMFKTKSDGGIKRKIQDTKVQESNEKKNQEQKSNIEEPERKESSSHKVKLVTEDESLRKGEEFLEKESNVSKRRPVEQEKSQELKMVEKQDRVGEDKEEAGPETKTDDGNSRMFEMSKLLELDESEEQKKIQNTMDVKSNATEREKKGDENIDEWEIQDKIYNRTKDQESKGQEPYELLRNGKHDKIPEYHREEEKEMEKREIEEMKRTAENVSSRKVQQIKDELEKHLKPSEIQESVKEKTQEHVEEEMNERREYKAVVKTESMALRESEDVEEKGSNQPNRYAEQELMTEGEGKEEYFRREGEQKEMAKRIPRMESKDNDDSSEINEIEGHELTGLTTSDQRKEEKEKEVARKADTIDECEEPKTVNLEKHVEEEMSEKLAEEETINDKEAKEGSRRGAVFGEGETKVRVGGFGKVREIEEQEQDKKQSYVENNTTGKAKENKNQETKKRDDSSRDKIQEIKKQESHEQKINEEEVVGKAETKDESDSSRIHEHEEQNSDKTSETFAEEETSNDKEAKEGNRAEVEKKLGEVSEIEEKEQNKKQSLEKDTSGKEKENKNQETKTQENEKQESHEQKRNEEQDKKNLGLVEENTNYCINEEDGKEGREIEEAEVPKKLEGIEKRESTKPVERHENRDNIKELVEDKFNNQEGENMKSMTAEVLEKFEDDESKGPEELRKQDKSMEHRLGDDLKDEETAKTDTKSKVNESRKKIHQIKEEETSEQERLKEKGMIKELVEDRTHYCREEKNIETDFDDGCSKKIQKRDKIQELVDRETSEDDEEELEIEFEDEEENWEAEVIQETDSDEDKDKIRQIKRIRLGFRLVGGSTLFMSLIVIVISFIRSKRKIKCYKF